MCLTTSPFHPPVQCWNGGSAKVRPKQTFKLYPACVRCLGRSAAHPPSPILIAEGCGEVATTQLPMSHYQCRSSCGGAKFFPSTVKIMSDVKIAAALQATSPRACVMRFHAPGNFASSQLAPPPSSAQQCPPNRLHQEGGKRVR